MPKHYYTRKKRKSTLGRKKNKSFRNRGGAKKSKKWVTAFSAASSTLNKTKSLEQAREKLREQALVNAQRLFGQSNESQRS